MIHFSNRYWPTGFFTHLCLDCPRPSHGADLPGSAQPPQPQGLRSNVRIRAGIRLVIGDLWNIPLPGIVPAERISRFDPAGSPEFWSELGPPVPDSSPPAAG
ncbi:hypothetical protein ACE1OC_41635 (plasmid) [Streptomyces sp. DSM 116496]|uniref:hypothetical protein n=1 Tax=Streptomyces stoeckheimensis TaxID=3344656 RepID=UPI0038B2CB97